MSLRFEASARAANVALVDLLTRVAEGKHATPAQIAFAWLLAQKPWIVPIPRHAQPIATRAKLGAASIELTLGDLRDINDAASKIPVQGARLPEEVVKLTNR